VSRPDAEGTEPTAPLALGTTAKAPRRSTSKEFLESSSRRHLRKMESRGKHGSLTPLPSSCPRRLESGDDLDETQ